MTVLALLDMDRGDLAGIERLDHLGAAGSLDRARRSRRAWTSSRPKYDQINAASAQALIVAISAMGSGGGGVSRNFERGRQEFPIVSPRDRGRRPP